MTDWLGCTFGGVHEPASEIIAESVLEEGGARQATLIGLDTKVSMAQAALVNGTASHALDYDDVNLALPGHLGVAIIPGLLALAEYRGATLADFFSAFVAGYETACRIGALVEPAHYSNGFHATATIGSLGSAVACAHLLKLSTTQASFALGLAATRAAGLKSMFGSMAKPLNAGLAAQAGLASALLAQKGFVSRLDALECTHGFAQTHSTDFHIERALAEPVGGYYILNNLFKFHAACFSTHSTIEAVTALRREHDLVAADATRIHVLADERCAMCNIQSPITALEAKFSLKATAAFALLGIDTAALDTWKRVTEAPVRQSLNKIHVDLVPGMGLSESVVTIDTADGRSLQRKIDCGTPLADKIEQTRRVAAKFSAIASPVIGAERSRRIADRLNTTQPGESVANLFQEHF